jgi:hypothetical protein
VKKEEDEMTSADTEMPKEATEEKAVKEEEEKEEKPRVNKVGDSALKVCSLSVTDLHLFRHPTASEIGGRQRRGRG